MILTAATGWGETEMERGGCWGVNNIKAFSLSSPPSTLSSLTLTPYQLWPEQ